MSLTKKDLQLIGELLETKLDSRFAEFEKKMDAKLDARFAEFENKMDTKFVDFRCEMLARMELLKQELIYRMENLHEEILSKMEMQKQDICIVIVDNNRLLRESIQTESTYYLDNQIDKVKFNINSALKIQDKALNDLKQRLAKLESK